MEPVVYEIDRNDDLRLLAGEWSRFAAANGAPELAGIVGQRLWTFIADPTTKYMYQSLVTRVRDGHSFTFHYRCDSPEQRRYMRMRMRQAPDEGVRFESDTLIVRHWPAPVRAFDDHASPDLLRVCSWCKRVLMDGRWEEPEVAVDRLGMFVGAHSSTISHGICEACTQVFERTLIGT